MTQPTATASLIDWRSPTDVAMQIAANAEKQVMAAKFAWSASGSITYNTAVALSLAAREATITVPDAKVGDRVQVFRSARPTLQGVDVLAGIFIEPHAIVWEDGKVPIVHTIPAVSAGQVLIIPLTLIGYRLGA